MTCGDKQIGLDIVAYLFLQLTMDLKNTIDSLETVLMQNPLEKTSSALVQQTIEEFDYDQLVYPQKVFDFPDSAKLALKPPRMIFIPSNEVIK